MRFSRYLFTLLFVYCAAQAQAVPNIGLAI
jgi:hypothetical protein